MTPATPEEGLALVLQVAGGVRPLARRLEGVLTRRAVQRWVRVPRDRLFAVAAATGLAPSAIRPDLEDWIIGERMRLRQIKAKETFALALSSGLADPDGDGRWLDERIVDILITLQAVRFVGGELEIAPAKILAGRARRELGAKSWAMALAHVVGRARASTIGAWFGSSRQNVDNASERYLRARDGDDPEDFLAGDRSGVGRVMERGRVRRAKAARVDLAEAERRFADQLAPVEPERRRA